MDGHIDSVSCMAKNPNHLKGIFSGSMDGGTCLFLVLVLYLLFVPIRMNLWMCLYILGKFHVAQISLSLR